MDHKSVTRKEEITEVACLLIPVRNKTLLLPNVSVAEIINFDKPVRRPEMPPWFLGHVEWRNTLVPVLSFELANGEPPEAGVEIDRIAVINSVSAQTRMPFFSIPVTGIPRLVRVTPESIQSLSKRQKLAEQTSVVVGEDREEAVIPNLDHLERMLLSVPFS